MRLPILDASRPAPLEAATRASRVLLVCMPFQHLKLSSLSLSLLATVLKNQGIACTEAYLHFEFANVIGRRTYTIVSDSGAKNTILGEVLFAEQHFGGADECTDRTLSPVFGDRPTRDAVMNR